MLPRPNPENHKALALYERLGFHPAETPEHLRTEWAAGGWDVIYLEIDAPV